jgi:site-specific DNA-cytosine methylase
MAGVRFDEHYFSEIDKYAISVYEKRFPDAIPLGDIAKINGGTLPKGDWIISGGFPCQDISVAGKGVGLGGSRSGLWFEYARLIAEIRPKFAIMENVGALTVRGLDRVLGSLAEIGYNAIWQDIRASDMGAPHRRERIWIVSWNPNSFNFKAKQKIQGGENSNSSGICGNVAYPNSERKLQQERDKQEFGERTGNGCKDDVADTLRNGAGEGSGELSEEFGITQIGEGRREGPEPCNGSETVADPGCSRFHQQGIASNACENSRKRSGIYGNGLSECEKEKRKVMADTGSTERQGAVSSRNGRDEFTDSGRCGGEIPNAWDTWIIKWERQCWGDKQITRRGENKRRGTPINAIREWWATEPDVGRVAHGIPSRVDRLKCCGNAVVPQIPMMIWLMIKEFL